MFPLLYRIQDILSGKPKREAKEHALAQQEKSLALQEAELQRQKAAIAEKERAFEQQQKHLNDLVRRRTVDMARNVASRDYLQSTPAFASLSCIEDTVPNKTYYDRLRSVLNTSMQIVSPFDISTNILSESGKLYHTTLYSCNCPDFQFRKFPCKHMLRLAIESGLLLNISTKPLENNISSLISERDTLTNEVSKLQHESDLLNQKQADFDRLLAETTQSYPWLAARYADMQSIYDKEIFQQLLIRARNIGKVKDLKKELQSELRIWRIKAKEAEYQLHFYETLFPWLLTFKEVPPIEAFEYATTSQAAPQEDQDLLRKYLSPEEYAKLSSCERYQLALDRYIERKKSLWEVGIEYERYIGYLCEIEGYSVHFTGATEKLEDMGRDLILEKGSQTILVQCKRWAKEKVIHENHIFQLAGSTYEYQYEHPERQVIGVFVTTVSFSPVAIRCAELLGLRLFPLVPFQNYPRIKCNIGKSPSGEAQKIYHLPMDQQYDSVKINNPGEFYAWTVKEAEEAGFRRAYRWHGK